MTRRPRDRKATIVTAAAELFADRGFAAVGIDDIGERVGITGPAIYRHFRNKDALLAAAVLGTIGAFEVDREVAAGGIERIAAAAAATALDAPARLATYVGERHRLTGEDAFALAEVEARIAKRWRLGIRTANPDLTPRQVGDRHGAVLAGLSAVAIRRHTVDRPRLDHLLVGAMVPVLLVPAGGHPSVDPLPPVSRPSSEDEQTPEPTRRDDILRRALELFRQRGYHGVGIDEIGEAAGITGPSVYFHYERKADILVDAFDRAGSRVAEGAAAAVCGASSSTDAVRRLAASYHEAAADNVDLIVVTSREGPSLPADLRPRFAARRHEIRGTWVDALRSARPDLDEPSARTLVAGVFPLVNQLAARRVAAPEVVALANAWLVGW